MPQPNPDFEPIYAALFAQLQTLTASFKLIDRRWRMPSKVEPADRPAIFQTQTGEKAERRILGQPSKWTLNVDLVMYTTGSDDPNSVPSTELNGLLKAIRTLFQPATPGTEITLGLPQVSHCRINGGAMIVENVNGSMAMAVIPIEILTTA